MSGDLPEDFVPRPTEYTALKEAVLSARSGTAVGVTTALRGAGGYGKTTLANYLCRDPEVRFEFTDGILRVEIGKERNDKERNDVTGLIVDLIEKIDPKGRRPGFQDVETCPCRKPYPAWQSIENRTMIECNEGSLQAHWLDGRRSDPVAGNA
jgi:hypothetical protein